MNQVATRYELIEVKKLEFGLITDNKMVGVAIASISTGKPTCLWWIADLKIMPKHQGQGHDSQFLEMLCHDLMSRANLPVCVNPAADAFGLGKIESAEDISQALTVGDKVTRNWYARHGFEDKRLFMIRYPGVQR